MVEVKHIQYSTEYNFYHRAKGDQSSAVRRKKRVGRNRTYTTKQAILQLLQITIGSNVSRSVVLYPSQGRDRCPESYHGMDV